MSFVGANDHSNPVSPQDPLYYAPRSARSMADPRSNATPQTSSDHLPPDPPLSRFDEMREEAFAKFARPLESQFAYERRRSRGLLATAGAIAVAIGATAILALVLFNVFPRSKSDPSELAVSISTPALATPAQATRPKTPRHCLKDSSSFKRYKEAKTRLFPNPPPLQRLRKRPKNPRLCSISSCSGSNGNSVENRTRRSLVESRRRTNTDITGATLHFRKVPTEIARSAADRGGLTPLGANARGKNEAFPLLRPVLADRCRSPQGCLRTMRVRLRGYSSAPTFRVRSRRSGSFGYRHALRVLARDAPSFVCPSFSQTAREFDRRCLDARSCRDRREKQWSGQVAGHLKLPCDRTRLVASRQAQREGPWQPRTRGQNVYRLPRTDRCMLLP